MPDTVFVFEVHQPFRLRRDILRNLAAEGIGGRLSFEKLFNVFFDNDSNREIFSRVAEKCYVKATKILLDSIRLVRKSGKDFKFALSISGVLIEQSLMWDKRAVEVFQEAVNEGAVEIIDQTYYHSLASLFSPDEFEEQLALHRSLMKEVFGIEPRVAENTEFIYNNEIANIMCRLGYEAVLTEGVERVLGWRSPNYVYRVKGCETKVLTRNYRLSDDIGFRFSDRSWDQYPLTADKYALWLSRTPGDVILIAIDYETFGEHHQPDTGIYEFLKWLPIEISKYGELAAVTPSEAIRRHPARDYIDVPPWETISWADERDLSAWLGNELQRRAFEIYTSIEPYAKAVGGEALRIWRYLGISDHLYYMATKGGAAGAVHHYFSPYKDVYVAYTAYIEALSILYTMIVNEVSSKPRLYAPRIVLPYSKAFRFYLDPYTPLSHQARSLKELVVAIKSLVPPESIAFHLIRGDMAKWVRNMFFLDDVAKDLEILGARVREGFLKVDKVKEETLRVFEHHLGLH
jgi:alpha-amylase